MEKIRAFIAIELSEDIKRTLIRLQNKLTSGCGTPVRWTSPNSTHLTLQFLGDIDSSLTERITAVMSEASVNIHPFRLSIQGLGVFPDPRRVRVVWVGLAGDLEILGTLQKRMESGLAPLGFKPEERAFTPHLTLGRVRDNARPDERQNLGNCVTRTAVENAGSLEVKNLHLIKSQLRPEGPLYTIISSIKLK
jgi:RNA 2',3'-cyclic 3'-phosphodiesterase